ncbi:MAG: tetratricopeptide repeat protein [Cryomorphaceae bacterium]|nr:tetratricopeptide repeat protein [Cryomorphaceae bacterium]
MKTITNILIIFTLISCEFKSSGYYNEEAQKLEKVGKYEEAIALLDKAIEKDPNNIYALINRGVDKSMLGDFQGAIEDYSIIIAFDPDNTLAYLNRGKNKKRLEDFQGAIEDFEKAIKTKGGELIYLDKVENSFIEMTDFEFDVAMEVIRFERGIARYYIDSLRTAFDDFNFCIHKNFELPESYYWRGMIYLAYGMHIEACIDLKKSQEFGDSDAHEIIEKYCKE